ncbi:MAG: hypothetical protein J5554_11360 [Paludibacteraceae bacterium]|nr:hypothetical protein [Paludibacteraceae bacterium]
MKKQHGNYKDGNYKDKQSHKNIRLIKDIRQKKKIINNIEQYGNGIDYPQNNLHGFWTFSNRKQM